MQNDKLLPCPFCNGEAVTLISKTKFSEKELWSAMCLTPHCITIPPFYETEEEIINAWNTRKLADWRVENEVYKM